MPASNLHAKAKEYLSVRIPEYALVALCGGTLYITCETLWRGWTHPSMFVCGAACFSVIYACEKSARIRSLQLITRSLLGGALITAVELGVGLLLNRRLGLSVWDYSDMPYNFLGQICLPMSALWVILSGGAILLCTAMRALLFDQQKDCRRNS